jgi:hypothetical protein
MALRNFNQIQPNPQPSTYIKFNIKLVFEHVLDVPAFPKPSCSFFIGLETKPIIVSSFVILDILKRQYNYHLLRNFNASQITN